MILLRRGFAVLFVAPALAFGQAPRPPIIKLSGLIDVSIASPTNNQVLTYDSTLGKWKNAAAGGGTFLSLTDTPSSYTGQSLKTLRVNAGETALEFTTGGGTPGGSNTQLQYNNSSVFGGITDATTDGSVLILKDLRITGDLTIPAWTTNGARIKELAGNLQDTTSSGSVPTAYTNAIGGNTIRGTNAITFNNYFGTYFKESIAGTNVTFNNKYAIGGDSARFGNGAGNTVAVDSTGALSATSPAFATSLTSGSANFTLLATPTTISAFAAATTLNIGASAAMNLNFGGATSASEFRFLEPSGSGTNYIGFAAQAMAGNIHYLWPAADGTSGYQLTTDGAGTLSWAAAGSGGGGDFSSNTATSVDSEFVLFSGTTGKLGKRATGSGIATVTSGVLGTTANNSTNWDTAFTDRLKWDGGATGLVAATGRTSLGANTVGSNIFTLTNPSAITWLEIAADNSVSTKTATQMKTDLGLTIGTNVEAWDADLDTLAGLTATTDNFIVSVASAWASRTPTQVRTTLGLTIGTNVEAWDTQLDSLAALGYTGNALKVVRVNAGETAFELAAAAGGAPGGSNTQVQYNNSSAFGGITNATSDGTTMTLTSPKVVTNILDTNANTLLGITATGTAVNNLVIANAATGGSPTLSAAGTNTDISITLTPKGAGQVLAPLGVTNNPGYSFIGNPSAGMGYSGSVILFSAAASNAMGITSTSTLKLQSVGKFSWVAAADVTAASDTALQRSSAAVVEVDNGTAGQWGALKSGVRDAGTATITNGVTIGHQSTGTPAANFGSGILFNANDATVADQNAGQVGVAWTDATDATRTSYMDFLLVSSAAALASKMRLFASGGLSVNSTSDPGAGIINANLGFRVTNAAAAGKVLIGDGTNLVLSTPTYPNAASPTTRKIIVSDGTNWTASTETYAVPGTSGNIMKSDGTNWTSAAGGGTGTLTATGLSLPNNAIVLGNVYPDTKAAAGLITDGTSKITLGVAGTSVGSIDFKNATSGTITVSPVTGALGTITQSLSAAAGTVAIDNITGHGDSIYTILGTDRIVATNAAFTASRTWTLPAANAIPVGTALTIMDQQGTLTATNTLVIARAGADTMNGGTANLVLSNAYSSITLVSDGTSKWTTVAAKQDIDVQLFTATGSGTWTKPVWFTPKAVRVVCVGGGGGGGAGASGTGATFRIGGSGGGGGGYAEVVYSAVDLGTTESVSVGVGGTAGVAGASGAVGGDGGIGGDSTFGTTVRLRAGGGGGGRGGAITGAAGGGGGGGGLGQAGTTGGTGTGTGGGPGVSQATGDKGSNGTNTGSGATEAGTGGGGGGGHDATPANAPGGHSYKGGGGGGQGTGTTAVPALVTARDGGDTNVVNNGAGGGGTAGTDGAAPTAGTAGAAGTTLKSGTGGGGGGGTITASVSGAVGGAGGAVGGGGGGGGCGESQTAHVGGGGGIGGRGEIRVYSW